MYRDAVLSSRAGGRLQANASVRPLHLLLMQGEQTQPNASEWKRLGLELAADKKLTAAVGPLTKACELDPKDEEACYYFARTLHALGRWDEARAPFEKALRAAPKPMLARVHRAVALNFMALGRTVEAEQNFKEAIATRNDAKSLPEDPRIDYGAFLFRQGRTDEALQLLQRQFAMRRNPLGRMANSVESFCMAANPTPLLCISKKQSNSIRARHQSGFCLGGHTCKPAASKRASNSFN